MQKEEHKFLWLSRAACFLVPKPAPTTPSDKQTTSVRPEFCFQDGEGVLAVFFKRKTNNKLQQLTFHISSEGDEQAEQSRKAKKLLDHL